MADIWAHKEQLKFWMNKTRCAVVKEDWLAARKFSLPLVNCSAMPPEIKVRDVLFLMTQFFVDGLMSNEVVQMQILHPPALCA